MSIHLCEYMCTICISGICTNWLLIFLELWIVVSCCFCVRNQTRPVSSMGTAEDVDLCMVSSSWQRVFKYELDSGLWEGVLLTDNQCPCCLWALGIYTGSSLEKKEHSYLENSFHIFVLRVQACVIKGFGKELVFEGVCNSVGSLHTDPF